MTTVRLANKQRTDTKTSARILQSKWKTLALQGISVSGSRRRRELRSRQRRARVHNGTVEVLSEAWSWTTCVLYLRPRKNLNSSSSVPVTASEGSLPRKVCRPDTPDWLCACSINASDALTSVARRIHPAKLYEPIRL